MIDITKGIAYAVILTLVYVAFLEVIIVLGLQLINWLG